MPHDRASVRIFADKEEEARFHRLKDQAGPIRQWVVRGGEAAERHVVPLICSGAIGITADEINAFIHTMKTQATKALQDGPKAQRPSPDECFMWRIGFEAAAIEAKIAFLNGLDAIGKATEAAILMAAGLEAATEALDLTATLTASRPVSTPAVSLGCKRPLRPEDFGALPLPPA